VPNRPGLTSFLHAAPAAQAHTSSLVPVTVAAVLLLAAAVLGALLAARR
jgi:hypothetical protein